MTFLYRRSYAKLAPNIPIKRNNYYAKINVIRVCEMFTNWSRWPEERLTAKANPIDAGRAAVAIVEHLYLL